MAPIVLQRWGNNIQAGMVQFIDPPPQQRTPGGVLAAFIGRAGGRVGAPVDRSNCGHGIPTTCRSEMVIRVINYWSVTFWVSS